MKLDTRGKVVIALLALLVLLFFIDESLSLAYSRLLGAAFVAYLLYSIIFRKR